jgi:hypothetical protein
MRNIFILYIPPSNYEAIVHYEDTIKRKVSFDRIYPYVDETTRYKLQNVFGSKDIAVWGSKDSLSNRAKFEKMQEGDDILIVFGNTIKLLGKIAAKIISPDLSKELWKDLKGKTSKGWSLIYFIANPQEIELPFSTFLELFNYSPNYNLRGFTTISERKLKEFYSRYDDLYSILLKIKRGEIIEEKREEEFYPELTRTLEAEIVSESLENDKEYLKEEVSAHLKMQWKLINLGIKAGSKVWIPPGDQTRINQVYRFDKFEPDFSAGLDVPIKYVENIDVIWKEKFRIDAAFEIENTTNMYAGLLRFSDLRIVAPNSTYPLFIVAPNSRKNILIEQLKRPTFRTLDLHRRVRFLSYEALEEIDKFFASSSTGLNVELLLGKSQALEES